LERPEIGGPNPPWKISPIRVPFPFPIPANTGILCKTVHFGSCGK
jgi:hypothetical protein